MRGLLLCRYRPLQSSLLILGYVVSGSLPSIAISQVPTNITSDGSLAPTPTIVTPPPAGGNTYNIDGGMIKGTNLFHSFAQFDVGTGDIASFNGPGGIQNIVSRVTGGAGSKIDGTIQSTISGANLYLLNPAGIMFGPNAQLNVSGSFHATTADYLKLSDGGVFYADLGKDSVLTSAPASAFGFLASNPAPIDVLRGGVDFNLGQLNVLSVPDGQTLSLVGGPIDLGATEQRDANGQITQDATPAYLLAPSGRINLVSLASPGEALIENNGGINADGFSQLGSISIKGGNVVVDGSEVLLSSIVDAPSIFVEGGRLEMNDAALFPGAFSFVGAAPPPDGGAVDVKVSGDVKLGARGIDPVILNVPGGIRSVAGLTGPGDPSAVPDIHIEADSVSLSGPVVIESDRLGSGEAGDVVVTSNTVEVRDGASMAVNNLYEGPGGNLTINAQDVLLSGDLNPGFTGLAAQSNFSFFYPAVSIDPALTLADGGTLTVNAAKSLTISNGAQITTDSFAFGRAGDIQINAGDMSLSSDGANIGAIASQSILAGNSGDIRIVATGQINMAGGFRISATTGGSGDGGLVDVTAASGINLSGEATGIFSVTTTPPQAALDQFASLYGPDLDYAGLRQLATDNLGIPDPTLFDVLLLLRDVFGVIAVDDLTVGDAGTISISTPGLTMNTGALVDSSTGWDGNAGEIQTQVDSLTVNTDAEIRSRSGFEVPDSENPNNMQLFVGTGNAGKVTINATDTISVSGANISTTTLGDGNGGNVSLIAANQVQVNNGGRITAESTGAGNAGTVAIDTMGPLTVSDRNSTISTTTSGDGIGGNIELTGRKIEIINGGSVTSDSFGNGLAGDIIITAGNKIDLNHGTISTRAVTSDGGNIKLIAPEWVYLLNSDVTTSVESGFGNGGNITIDPQFVILNQSNIVANAYGGNGGKIDIVADVIRSAQSRIDASSALGINGTVNISNPDQDVAQELAVLPENFLDVSGLINDRCGARAGASSLVSAGPGGLAVDPDDYLPSFGTTTNAVYNGAGKSGAINSVKPGWAMAVDPSALQLARFTCNR